VGAGRAPVQSRPVSVKERTDATTQRGGLDGTPSPTPPPTWLVAVAVLVAAAGAVTRFVTTSSLWLDEALSVNIATLPVGDIGEALRHDGHPPLYYLLLHVWADVFGTGDVTVRALSGVLAVLSLPVAYLVGRRAGGARLGWLTVLVLGALPFATRYGTEARMYSLVILLVLLGWLALQRALDVPSAGRLALLALVSGALLLTHYWAFYLLGATGLVLLVGAWRGSGDRRRTLVRTAVGVAAGGVFFLPWLPSFLEQARSTGTPWAEAERPTKVLALLFSDLGGVDNAERILFSVVLGLLLALGLFGRARDDRTVELDLRTRPDVRGELLVAGLTLALAVAAGYLTSSGFAPRYLAMIVVLVVLGAAWGLHRFTGTFALAVVLLAYLSTSALGIVDVIQHQRTQMDDLASIIERDGQPGDVVVYCPDQLGPAGSHALDGDFTQVTYPDLDPPEFVDWVDYAERNAASDPAAFVDAVVERAEGHTIWLAWSPEYVTLETQCGAVRNLLSQARPGNGPALQADSDKFFENANLHRYPDR
jgi:mannosyltransferase